eukprot:TRINITY_DN100_c0_g1_i2.p3 TRINITY_DN100_c0_g1~~TRINITY_DN100_c0_g1_i2.p3  ORF type:complete len:202 (-),score=20.18 TRINITY_DN100_c0_g1_i2:258-863(-)
MDFDEVDLKNINTKPKILGEQVFNNAANAVSVQRYSFEDTTVESYTYSFSQTLSVGTTIEISASVPEIFSVKQSFTFETSVQEGKSNTISKQVKYAVGQEVRANPYSCIRAFGSMDVSTGDVDFPFLARFKVSQGSGDISMASTEKLLGGILSQGKFSGEIEQKFWDHWIVSVRGVLTTGLAVNMKLTAVDIPPGDPDCDL